MQPLPRQVHIAPATWNGIPEASVPAMMPGSGADIHETLMAGAPPEIQEMILSFRPDFKPEGGFWTSSLLPGGGSAWEDFTGRRPDAEPTRFLFDVVGTPRILVLEDDADVLRALGRQEDGRVTNGDTRTFWELVAREWDAVHVPEHHSRRGCLYPWDVESTVWLRPDLHLRAAGREPVPRPRSRSSRHC